MIEVGWRLRWRSSGSKATGARGVHVGKMVPRCQTKVAWSLISIGGLLCWHNLVGRESRISEKRDQGGVGRGRRVLGRRPGISFFLSLSPARAPSGKVPWIQYLYTDEVTAVRIEWMEQGAAGRMQIQPQVGGRASDNGGWIETATNIRNEQHGALQRSLRT